MKVIQTSNYDLDFFKETQMGTIGMTKGDAQDMADALNSSCLHNSSVWHMVVDDDYELSTGDPNE